MDNIEKLLKEISADRDVRNCFFSSNFLNNVADVFERHGFGVTKTFLLEKKDKQQLRNQAVALLSVLNKFDTITEIRQNRSIGRYIFKTLITIKSMEG